MILTDPLGAFERLRDNFILYVQTAFRTRFPSLEEERLELLRRTGMFHQIPYIETRFRYQGFRTLDAFGESDLPGLTGNCASSLPRPLTGGVVRRCEGAEPLPSPSSNAQHGPRRP